MDSGLGRARSRKDLHAMPQGFKPWHDASEAIRAVFKHRQGVNRAKL